VTGGPLGSVPWAVTSIPRRVASLTLGKPLESGKVKGVWLAPYDETVLLAPLPQVFDGLPPQPLRGP